MTKPITYRDPSMRPRLLGLLAATAAIALTTAAANAADLPVRSAPPALPAFTAVPVFTWTGFYVGVNAGYGFSNQNDENVFVPAGTFGGAFATTSGVVSNGGGRDEGGFVGGGQVGYNY